MGTVSLSLLSSFEKQTQPWTNYTILQLFTMDTARSSDVSMLCSVFHFQSGSPWALELRPNTLEISPLGCSQIGCEQDK